MALTYEQQIIYNWLIEVGSYFSIPEENIYLERKGNPIPEGERITFSIIGHRGETHPCAVEKKSVEVNPGVFEDRKIQHFSDSIMIEVSVYSKFGFSIHQTLKRTNSIDGLKAALNAVTKASLDDSEENEIDDQTEIDQTEYKYLYRCIYVLTYWYFISEKVDKVSRITIDGEAAVFGESEAIEIKADSTRPA